MQNILEADALMLIDWEFSGMGDPFFDLAVFVRHHSLEDEMTGVFVNAYLGHEAGPAERERLRVNGDFYACLLELWNR